MIHGTRPRPASILPTTHAPALLRDGVPGRTAVLTIPRALVALPGRLTRATEPRAAQWLADAATALNPPVADLDDSGSCPIPPTPALLAAAPESGTARLYL